MPRVGGLGILVGLTAGSRAEIDLGTILRKRLRIVGTTLRPRPFEEKIEATQRFRKEVLPLFEARKVQPVLDEVYALEQAAEAHRQMEENANFGKLVIAVSLPGSGS